MRTIRIHLDAHAHIYPFYDVPRLLVAALDHMPRHAPTDLRVLALAERAECSFFQALAQDEIQLPGDRWRIIAWDPDGGVKVRHLPDARELWIIAGRQFVTAERLELCALGSDAPHADGQPAVELARAILTAGGLPALNWAPGKWLFARGKTVKALLQTFSPTQLVLVDSSLRPFGWPAPAAFRSARRAGRAVLAGSDPLPFGGEEIRAGSYHCTFTMPALADAARLVAELKTALANGPKDLRWQGRRGTPATVWQRLRRNAKVPPPAT
ncbi:MAG: hypothetical protein KBI43_03525 [Kiritimatiellae bacterium]|nr:hypothetical protein [Kiritimatiellia bacterium]